MTLQQLKYAITVAETRNRRQRQPTDCTYPSRSLTNAIHELEKEMNILNI